MQSVHQDPGPDGTDPAKPIPAPSACVKLETGSDEIKSPHPHIYKLLKLLEGTKVEETGVDRLPRDSRSKV